MPSTKIPSPARSLGVISTPRKQVRRTQSVGSPARTNIRLSSIIESYKVSPVPHRQSVLNDDTDIDMPRRLSWWKKIDDNSRDVLDLLERKEIVEANNVAEEFDVELLSQENKNYALDLPESSDNESINSIVIPQRKLFIQKENQPREKFRQIKNNRETLQKLNKSYVDHEQDLNVGRKTLFSQPSKPRTKPVFPAALLDISAKKTVNKTKEIPAAEVKGQVRSLFGGRPGIKRKNMFADFIVSESEDEISDIQPKVFGFQKRNEPKRRASSMSRQSPTSSIDLELEDWRLLPSSTLVENQLNEAAATPVKRIKLSNLLKTKDSEISANTLNKTKTANISISSKNKSVNLSNIHHENDKSHDMAPINDATNNSRVTRSMIKKNKKDKTTNNLNVDAVEDKNDLVKEPNETISKENVIELAISTNKICENQEGLLDNKQNNSQEIRNVVEQKLNKSINENKNKSRNSERKYNEHSKREDMQRETSAKDQSINKDEEKDERLGKSKQNLNVVNHEDQDMENEKEENENDNYFEQHSDQEEEPNESTKEETNHSEIEEDINEDEQLENESHTEKLSEEEPDDEEEEEVINESNTEERYKKKILDDKRDNIENKNQVTLANVSHDTTGRHRKTNKSPEVILHGKTKQMDSFTVQPRNTSVRKTKSIIFHNKLDTVTDPRKSTGFSDATGNSSAEGSGWDSHRTTRKTLRQTFGKDFTPRKSLRALVIEKSAKLQANFTEVVDNVKIPQANSTEYDQVQDDMDSYQETEVQLEQNIGINQDVRDVTELLKNKNKLVNSEETEKNEQIDIRKKVDQTKSDEKHERELAVVRAETEQSKERDETNQPEQRNEMDLSENEGRSETKPFEEREAMEQTESFGRNETEHFNEREEVEESEENEEEEESEVREEGEESEENEEEEESELREEVEENEEEEESEVREEVEESEVREEVEESEVREEVEESEENEEEEESEVREEVEESEVIEESEKSDNEERDATEQFRERDEMEQSEDETEQLEERNHTVLEEIMEVASDHEETKQTRQASLETYLLKIQQDNAEKRRKMQEELRNSLKMSKRDAFNLFKVPQRPVQRSIKIQKPKVNKIKSVIPLEMLPSDVIDDMKYKPPKRFQPNNASWITKRLYKFLETKLEPKYDYKARVRAEKLVQCIYNFSKEVRRHDVVRSEGVDELKREMARLNIVQTHFDFYEFCHEFFPREIRVKVVPDIINNIQLPRHGVFSDILR